MADYNMLYNMLFHKINDLEEEIEQIRQIVDEAAIELEEPFLERNEKDQEEECGSLDP